MAADFIDCYNTNGWLMFKESKYESVFLPGANEKSLEMGRTGYPEARSPSWSWDERRS